MGRPLTADVACLQKCVCVCVGGVEAASGLNKHLEKMDRRWCSTVRAGRRVIKYIEQTEDHI
jgi:hypothetical protein